MQRITPHLWFDKEAREAAELYVSTIPGSKIANVTRLTGTPSGDCDLVSFELGGQPFMAISAGPLFKFNPSISFQVKCESAKEVDEIFEALSPNGKILMPLDKYYFLERYGWIEDKYGVSWQVMYSGSGLEGQRITPMLMFVGGVCGKAEEALDFYTSVFSGAPDGMTHGQAKTEIVARYGEGGPDAPGTVQYSHFWLSGQEFSAMDSARQHDFAFNEAISFTVPCDTQEEIDYFWNKLSADPKAEACGWLKGQIRPVVANHARDHE